MGLSKDGDGTEGCGLSVVGGSQSTGVPSLPEPADKATSHKLLLLREEHRELDEKIQTLIGASPYDQLELTRLKKRKLMLRDQITRIEDDIVPDIIA